MSHTHAVSVVARKFIDSVFIGFDVQTFAPGDSAVSKYEVYATHSGGFVSYNQDAQRKER